MTNPRSVIAVIGGTGFYEFFDGDVDTVTVDTPYGHPSADITIGSVDGVDVAFVPRHGRGHEYAPHTVPYRANMWALRTLGVRHVVAPCAVGSLDSRIAPGTIAIPDQLVDRTSGRPQTYFDAGGVHVSFADPYCARLRRIARERGGADGGTMVIVEGPRFSTRAESSWYASLGWSLINMTGHPEAVLARELELCYTPVALVTDLDAGIDVGDGVRAADVFALFAENLGVLKQFVREVIGRIDHSTACAECKQYVHTPNLPIELP